MKPKKITAVLLIAFAVILGMHDGGDITAAIVLFILLLPVFKQKKSRVGNMPRTRKKKNKYRYIIAHKSENVKENFLKGAANL